MFNVIIAELTVVKSSAAVHSKPQRREEEMDMETILEETVATEDLKKFEQKYHVELNEGKVKEKCRSLCWI